MHSRYIVVLWSVFVAAEPISVVWVEQECTITKSLDKSSHFCQEYIFSDTFWPGFKVRER